MCFIQNRYPVSSTWCTCLPGKTHLNIVYSSKFCYLLIILLQCSIFCLQFKTTVAKIMYFYKRFIVLFPQIAWLGTYHCGSVCLSTNLLNILQFWSFNLYMVQNSCLVSFHLESSTFRRHQCWPLVWTWPVTLSDPIWDHDVLHLLYLLIFAKKKLQFISSRFVSNFEVSHGQ